MINRNQFWFSSFNAGLSPSDDRRKKKKKFYIIFNTSFTDSRKVYHDLALSNHILCHMCISASSFVYISYVSRPRVQNMGNVLRTWRVGISVSQSLAAHSARVQCQFGWRYWRNIVNSVCVRLSLLPSFQASKRICFFFTSLGIVSSCGSNNLRKCLICPIFCRSCGTWRARVSSTLAVISRAKPSPWQRNRVQWKATRCHHRSIISTWTSLAYRTLSHRWASYDSRFVLVYRILSHFDWVRILLFYANVFVFVCACVQDPQPFEPSDDIINAQFHRGGSMACQSDLVLKRQIGAENCLHLSVYTRDLKPDVLKPVMVWIHGGAFVYGSNAKEFTNPEFLLRNDVVVIAINYRLGAFGEYGAQWKWT